MMTQSKPQNQKSLKILSLSTCLFLLTPNARSQTRIVPPQIELGESAQRSDATTRRRRSHLDIEIPIPIATPAGMPFLAIDQSTQQTQRFSRDLKLSLGLLHHAAEGAPLWKIEAGPWLYPQRNTGLYHQSSFNLEKVFPILRPNNSDQLDSWIKISTLTSPIGLTKIFPELGWVWQSNKGLRLEAILPRRIMIGWRELSWLGSLGYKEEWFLGEDSNDAKKIAASRTQFAVLEATRYLDYDCYVTAIAGIELPRSPHYGLRLGWMPQP